MKKSLLIFAAISGAIAVAFGALGAHALKEVLEAKQMSSFETAVRYQFYHTLVLLFMALIAEKTTSRWFNVSTFLFQGGIILFSGSLFLLSTRALTGISAGWLGPITPLGGLLLIGGWALLIPVAISLKRAE